MISRIEMILLDVILSLMTYQIHFHFPLRGTSPLLVQILKILKLKFENFKTSFKPWFPESKWFFWMSYYRWWPIKYIFIFRYAAQVFACSNFKDFKIEIWKF